MFNNILIVCIGNICRSPMAQGLFVDAFKDNPSYTIRSAGLSALVGQTPDKLACELMLNKGIDISSYIACQLNTEMIIAADIILVMDLIQQDIITSKEMSAKGKIFRVGEWSGFDIPDPYKKDLAHFENSLQLIELGLGQWIKKF